MPLRASGNLRLGRPSFAALYALHAPWLTVFTLAPHVLLPLTSFIFTVLPKRHVESRTSMFIWSELRLHAAIFSLRSCLVILLPALAIPIVALALVAADLATHYRGTPGVSTVRGRKAPRGAARGLRVPVRRLRERARAPLRAPPSTCSAAKASRSTCGGPPAPHATCTARHTRPPSHRDRAGERG